MPKLTDGEPKRLRGRDVAISATGNVASLLSAIIGAPILAQALGVEQRGIVAGAIAPLMLLLGIATLGIPEAATYYIANRTETPRRIAGRASAVILAIGTATALAVFQLANVLAAGSDQLARLIKIAACALPLALVTLILRAVAAGLHAWTLIAIERAIFGSVRLTGFVLLLAIGHLDALSAVLVLAASTFIGALAYLRLFKRDTSSDTETRSKARLVRYGSRFWIGSVAGVLLTRLDQVLMVPLASSTQLGLYAVAVNIAEIPLVISMAVRDVVFSVESESSSGARVAAAARITTAVVLAISLLLVAAAYPLVPIFFGDEFADSIPSIIILLAAMSLATAGSIGGMALAARGQPGLRSVALTAACIINAIMLIVLVPRYGATGAAIATLAGNAVFTVLIVWLCKFVIGIPALDFIRIGRHDLSTIFQIFRNLTAKLWRRLS